MTSFFSVEQLSSLSPQAQALVSAMAERVASAPASDVVASNSQVGGNAFGQMVSKGLNEVNRRLIDDQTDLQRLAMGEVQNLHQVMIKLEESRLSFQLAMQVRNRALEAYQELMRMSV